LLVQPGVQAAGGIFYQHIVEQPVAHPIKEEYPA
jgi:hypothetical protein